MLRSPELARLALRLPEKGSPARQAGTCVCCAARYEIGELVSPLEVSHTFTDGRRLRHTPNAKPFSCVNCSPFFRKPAMQKLQKVIITQSGAFPISQGANRAWFLLHPPKPPFTVLFSNAKQQHLVWSAPITLDQDHWLVQLGPRTLSVRRQHAFATLAACERISAKYLAVTGKQLKSPYSTLDPELGTIGTGAIRPDIERFCRLNGLRGELNMLQSIGTGELWALNPLLFRREIATQPDRLELAASLENSTETLARDDEHEAATPVDPTPAE